MKLELTKVVIILFTLCGIQHHAVAQNLSSPEVNQLPLSIQSLLRLDGIVDVSIQTYLEADAERWRQQSQSQLVAASEASLRQAFQLKDDLTRQRQNLRTEYFLEISRHNIFQRWLEHYQRWLWNGTFAPRDLQLEKDIAAQEVEIETRRQKLEELRNSAGRKGLDPQAEIATWVELNKVPPHLKCEAEETSVQFKPWRAEGKEAMPFGGHDRDSQQYEFLGCQNAKKKLTKLSITDRKAPAISYITAIEFDVKDQFRGITISRQQAGVMTTLEKRIKSGGSWTIVPIDRTSSL